MIFDLNGITFGGTASDLIVTTFDPGSVDLRVNDNERPQRDGFTVGKDFLGLRTWSWELTTNGRNLSDSLQASGELEAIWRNPSIRLTPNKPVALRYQLNGRWRRVYGRPNRFTGIHGDVLAKAGAGRLSCDFRVTDPRFYDDAATTINMSIVPATTGGMTTPMVTPLTTLKTRGVRAGFATNSGDVNTPLEIKFIGPITDPYIESADGWRVGFNGTLAYDQYVVINPFAGTVLRNDGVSLAGSLSRQTRLSKVFLRPGTSELTFGGKDLSGTARAELSWRNAHSSI